MVFFLLWCFCGVFLWCVFGVVFVSSVPMHSPSMVSLNLDTGAADGYDDDCIRQVLGL